MAELTQEAINLDKNIVPIDKTKKHLSFITDDLLFGIEASSVVEIITNHHITRLPMVSEYIRGVINLRGQIIPIIDIRLRLGRISELQGDQNCIIVVTVESETVGLLVDTVSQVLDINTDEIAPPSINDLQGFVYGMVSLPGGTMLLLDCKLLL